VLFFTTDVHFDLPKNYASVFCSSPGMFPGPPGELNIDSAAISTINPS
jgi:hypothetical protein